MFLQSSKALCCLNKVHLQDNKALEDTWCWFEVNGFSMAHIPKNKLCLFNLFHLFNSSCFFLLPHISPFSCFSPHISLYSLSAAIYSSSTKHFDNVTVWSWVDLGSHTWECIAAKGAGWLLISQDLFQSFEGGKAVEAYKGREKWKPSSPKPWQKDQALHAKAVPAPCAQTLALSKVQTYMYALQQIPTSEDRLKNTHTNRWETAFHFFDYYTWGLRECGPSFPETQ